LRAGEKLKLEHNTDAIAKHLKSSGVADGEKARILAKGTMARHDKSVSKSIIMKQSGAIK
jgi:hypothetical protein